MNLWWNTSKSTMDGNEESDQHVIVDKYINIDLCNLIHFLCSQPTPVTMWFYSLFLLESAAASTDQEPGTR